MMDFIKYILIIVIGTCSLLYMGNLLEGESCHKKAKLMNLDHRYSFLTGCFVNYKGEWQSTQRIL